MTLTSRQFAYADYPAVHALLRQIVMLGAHDYGFPGDLDWWRVNDQDADAILSARVWLDADALVGFAWVAKDAVDMMGHPNYPDITDSMLVWSEQQRRATTGDEQAPTLKAWSLSKDEARIAVLRERGYEQGDVGLVYLRRALDEPPPSPVLPDGYSVRSIDGEAELVPRVEVHRDAFSPSRMTPEKYRRIFTMPNYRPDHDLVTVAPDGMFASFTIVWHDDPTKLGLFEPVGTHSAHRQRGLGKAVMIEGLRRLWAAGARRAHVNSAPDNGASLRLYTSLGFTELDRLYGWTKRV